MSRRLVPGRPSRVPRVAWCVGSGNLYLNHLCCFATAFSVHRSSSSVATEVVAFRRDGPAPPAAVISAAARPPPLRAPAAPSASLAPPQLKRPNVSTEDVSAWNTDGSAKKHKSWNEKEKLKRSRGQASRDSTFNEDIKRQARTAGGVECLFYIPSGFPFRMVLLLVFLTAS